MKAVWLALFLALPAGAAAQDFDTDTHTAASPQAGARAEANKALEARDYARAVQLLKPLAEANSHDAVLLFDLGSAQDALDQSSPAETSYKAAIAADAGMLEAHVALGLLYARTGRFAEARSELVVATGVPDRGQALDALLKARAYRALARIDQNPRPADARDELLAALKLSPETPEDTMLTAELAETAGGGSAAAEAALHRLLATRPGDAEASASLAHLLAGEKRNDEAEALLRSALTANPGDPVLTAQLATLLNGEGKPAEALPLVVSLHAAHPENADVADLLAGLYAATGDYAQAEPLYATLSTQAPGDVALAVAHANTLVFLKRFAEAETILARAVSEPTRFASPADLGDAAGRLAFAASEAGDPNGALRAIALRGTVLPPSATILFLAAISEDKLRQTRPAIEAYKRFLAASNGTLPDQEFEARHRLVALEHTK